MRSIDRWKADQKTFFTRCNRGDLIYKEAHNLKETLVNKNKEIANADPGKIEYLWKTVQEGYPVEEVEMYLLNNGLDVNVRDDNQWTFLHTAAFKGNAEMVKMFLYYGAELDPRNTWGFTPLHQAANGGHREVCSILLEAGADVNARTNEDFTPLHLAANKGWNNTIDLLVDAGANEDLKTLAGYTAEDLLRFRMNKNMG